MSLLSATSHWDVDSSDIGTKAESSNASTEIRSAEIATVLGQFAKSAGYRVALPKVLISTEGKVFINIGTKVLLENSNSALRAKDLKLQGI